MFDPYKKWLGIQPKDQPPNHYRLLSLDNFESDLDVIEGAADRQMGFIRQYQSGEHAVFAAKILNEIATARLCLLKPTSKAEYDAKLKKQLAASETTEEKFVPFDNDPEVAAMMKAPKLERKRKRKKSKSPPAAWIAGGVLGVLVLVLVMSSGNKASVKNSDPSPEPVVESAASPVPTQSPSPSKAPQILIAETPQIAPVRPQQPADPDVKTESTSSDQEPQAKPSPFKKTSPAKRPETKVAKSRVELPELSELVGGQGGIPFHRDLGEKPMVGVIWTQGSWGGTFAIGNIMPIAAKGASNMGGIQVIAPKGYAVGGMKVCAPKFVSHVQLIFMKMNEDGTLDPSKTKPSEWLGGKPKGEVIELSGEGRKVIGLHGRSAAVIDALGLIYEPEQ